MRPCWGEFVEVKTGVKVVDPWDAAACSKVANCSGLYSVLGIFVGLGSLVTADMLGNRTEAGVGGAWVFDNPDMGVLPMEVGATGPAPPPPLDRTSTML